MSHGVERAVMPRLSDCVEIAATEYLQETGQDELNARWSAAYFRDSGVQDADPRQDLVAFNAMVQKALTLKSECAAKRTRFQLDKVAHFVRRLRKP
jgi:ubiquinone/menaquinone biosynthesis C-methylase UbiE